jgi:hypothetical protein
MHPPRCVWVLTHVLVGVAHSARSEQGFAEAGLPISYLKVSSQQDIVIANASAKGEDSTSTEARSIPREIPIFVIAGVVTGAATSVLLVAVVWWRCIKGRRERNPTGGQTAPGMESMRAELEIGGLRRMDIEEAVLRGISIEEALRRQAGRGAEAFEVLAADAASGRGTSLPLAPNASVLASRRGATHETATAGSGSRQDHARPEGNDKVCEQCRRSGFRTCIHRCVCSYAGVCVCVLKP